MASKVTQNARPTAKTHARGAAQLNGRAGAKSPQKVPAQKALSPMRPAGRPAAAPPASARQGVTSGLTEGQSLTPAIGKHEEPAAPMTPKNFRNHPDMENFFRFIYENDLRIEALHIIDEIIEARRVRRSAKKGGDRMAAASKEA